MEKRLEEFKLELHPEKTKIVYCKDVNRKGGSDNNNFTFLGYEFRPQKAKNKYGGYFLSLIPAISEEAKEKMRRTIREWQIQRFTNKSIENIAQDINKIVMGWINYYGKFCSSELYPIKKYIDLKLVKWAVHKYKKIRGSQRCANKWLKGIKKRKPELFAHWR